MHVLKTGYLFVFSLLLLASTSLWADDSTKTSQSSPSSPPPQKILVWGDSLSAAYGIPVEKGWVNLLQDKLGKGYQVTNGSVSGETTVGGLTRLPDALKAHTPDYVLLELGANDGLRGLPISQMQDNLTKMIEQAQVADAKPVLIGILLPPNYGMAYTEKFQQVYKDLAERYQLPFIPFLLEGVAQDFKLLQADGLHPTAEAQPIILEHLWKTLEGVLLPTTTTTATATAPATAATTKE